MMPRQGKLLSYLTFLSVKEVLERGEKSKGILSCWQHCDNSVSDTLGSRSGFDKASHPTEQLAISRCLSCIVVCRSILFQDYSSCVCQFLLFIIVLGEGYLPWVILLPSVG